MRTILALLLFTLPVHAATLSSTRTKVDTWLTNAWTSQIVPKQDAYFAAHGRYWQGLLSTTAIPAFTTAANGDSVADSLTSKPHYQAESIYDMFPSLDALPLPCAFLCDQYVGPLGAGYTVTVFVKYNGVIYTRSQNNGPEKWRTQAWSVWNPSSP